MPCKKDTHHHSWKTEGILTIERCETACGFCGKEFKYGWFLRRHVRDVHTKEYANLTVNEGWTGSPQGNRRPISHDRRGRNRSTSSTGSSFSFETSVNSYSTPTKSIIRENALFDLGIEVFTAYREDCKLPASDLDFYNNPPPVFTTNTDINTYDLSTLFDTSVRQAIDYSTMTNFVTPQYVRTSAGELYSEVPTPEHHLAAGALAEGLNNVVGTMVVNGTLTEAEVLYVLETFTNTFKVGVRVPF